MDTRTPRAARRRHALLGALALAACSSCAHRARAAAPHATRTREPTATALRAAPALGPLIVSSARERHAGTCDDPVPAVEGAAPAAVLPGGDATVYALTLSRPGRVALGTRIGYSLCARTRCEDAASALPGACLPDEGYAHELVADLPAGRTYVLVARRANVSDLSDPDAVRLDARPSAGTTAAEVCASAQPLVAGAMVEGELRPHEVFEFGTVPSACGAIDYARPSAYRLALASRSRVRVRAEATPPAPDPEDAAATPFALVPVLRGACADARTDLACGDDDDAPPRGPWEVTALRDAGESALLIGANSPLRSPLPFRVRAEIAPPDGTGGVPGDAPTGSLAPLVEMAEGDTFAARDDARAACAREAGGADVYYALDLARRSLVELWLERANFAAAVSARPAGAPAGDEDLMCATQPTPRAPAVAALAPGRYVVSVDGESRGEFGRFVIGSLVRDAAWVERACIAAPVLTPGSAVRGATQIGRGEDRFTSSCAAERGAPDVVYRVVVPQRSRVSVTVSVPGESHDPVLSIRRQCLEASSEVACAPPHRAGARGANGGTEGIDAVDLEAGTYYVVVDGQGARDAGPFELRVDAEPVASR